MSNAGSSVYPLLRSDESSLDWERARYKVQVSVRADAATVEHTLVNAPEIETLLRANLAVYALEVRCPQTLYSWIHRCPEHRFTVRWSQDYIDGLVYLIPGILTTRRVSLPTTGLADLWGQDMIALPAHCWLAKGSIWASKNLAASLVSFTTDDKLKPGTMKIVEVPEAGEPHFMVFLASDLYERIHISRDVQVAGLIGAFAKIQQSVIFDEESESSLVVARLRENLQDAGIPTWDDEEWDPALAATTVENFELADIRELDA